MDLRGDSLTVEFTEADQHSQPAIKRLVEAGFNVHRLDTPQAECLWVRLRTSVNAALLKSRPQLRYVVTATTGTDHIDVAECQRRGVSVLSLCGETDFLRDVRATAEHTLSLMLWCLRGWTHDMPFVRPKDSGGELAGKRVGIIGMGRIGTQVAELVKAFGATVHQTHREVDIVSVHVPLNESTKRMISYGMFGEMQKGVMFINTSRGAVVHEPALLHSLKNGIVSRAALDVVDNERVWDSVLQPFRRDNPSRLLITPHIGGYTKESLEKCELFMAEKLLKHVEAECSTSTS